MIEEGLKVKFIGEDDSLTSASKEAAQSLDDVSKSSANATKALSVQATVSQKASKAASDMAKNAAAAGGAIDHVGNRSSTARFAVQNLSNVIRDIPFGVNNPAIFATALDHVVASMTMLNQEARQMSQATGETISGFGLLKQSLAGGGGLLLGFNALSLAATFLLPKLFETGSAAESQADKMKKARQAIDDYVASLDDISQARVKGSQSAQEELTKLNTLYKATQDANIPLAERKKIVDELQEQYPKYFKNISDEIILAGGAKKAYDDLSSAILASARARAAQDALVDIQKQLLVIEQKYATAVAETAKAQQKFQSEKKKAADQDAQYTEEDRKNSRAFITNLDELGSAQSSLNNKLKVQNDLTTQRNDLLDRAKQLTGEITRITEQNPASLLNPTGSIKAKATKEDKTAFLFEFLPFDPSGKLKPEQRGELLNAIDKFSKEFGTIFQGANFTGTENARITAALKFDAELRAGNIKFDVNSFRTAIDKSLKPEELLPPDELKVLSTQVVGQFIRSFQDASESIKNANVFGDIDLLSTDKIIDRFKTKLAQLGRQLPQNINAKDIFGNTRTFSLSELFDTSKVQNKDAIEALANFFKGVQDEAVTQLNAFKSVIGSLATETFSSIGEAIGTALAGGDFGKVFQNLFSFIGGAIADLGKQMISLSPVIAALKAAIKTLNPALLLPAGIGLVAIGSALKNIHPKGFAAGGLAFGPTLGLVGEGSGTSASNPEIIAPLDKLKNFISPRSEFPEYLPVINLSYDQLRVMYQRADKQRRTFGG